VLKFRFRRDTPFARRSAHRRGTLAKILVIEDDVTFLGLLRVHLAGIGHEVQTAEDAALGLRAIMDNPPDIIILDIYVPYLDGFELLETLRTDPATVQIPIIVLTGRSDDELYAKAQSLGVADYFTKPVQRDTLIKSIEKVLASHPRRPDPG
jgi:DNA-binding response OmpR family regulator